MPQDVTITIHVNTVGLTTHNVPDKVTVTDTLGDHDDTPGNSTTFDTIVNGGDNLTWIGVQATNDQTPDVTILVDSITSSDSLKLFAQGPTSQSNGTVTAKVKGNGSSKKISGEYSINFSVKIAQVTTPGFSLDPKLQIRKNS